MLIPQFSIRWLLMVMTACAGIFSFFGFAVRGNGWAIGFSIGIVSAAVAIFFCGLLFAVVWLFSVMMPSFGGRVSRATSPFAPGNEGDRSMFSADVSSAIHILLPKKGPVPSQPVSDCVGDHQEKAGDNQE